MAARKLVKITVDQARVALADSAIDEGKPLGRNNAFVQAVANSPPKLTTADELGRAGVNAVVLFAELRAITINQQHPETWSLTDARALDSDVTTLERIRSDMEGLLAAWSPGARPEFAPGLLDLDASQGSTRLVRRVPGDRLRVALPEVLAELEVATWRAAWLDENSQKNVSPKDYFNVMHATRIVRFFDLAGAKRPRKLSKFLRDCWRIVGRPEMTAQQANHLITRVDKHILSAFGIYK